MTLLNCIKTRQSNPRKIRQRAKTETKSKNADRTVRNTLVRSASPLVAPNQNKLSSYTELNCYTNWQAGNKPPPAHVRTLNHPPHYKLTKRQQWTVQTLIRRHVMHDPSQAHTGHTRSETDKPWIKKNKQTTSHKNEPRREKTAKHANIHRPQQVSPEKNKMQNAKPPPHPMGTHTHKHARARAHARTHVHK